MISSSNQTWPELEPKTVLPNEVCSIRKAPERDNRVSAPDPELTVMPKMSTLATRDGRSATVVWSVMNGRAHSLKIPTPNVEERKRKRKVGREGLVI